MHFCKAASRLGSILFETVLRIHEILVLTRIRIRESISLTNGSGLGSGSCYFRQWPFWRSIYIIFQRQKVIKKSQNSTGSNQCFSYNFCWMIKGSGAGAGSGSRPTSLTNGSRSGRPTSYGSYESGFGSTTLIRYSDSVGDLFCTKRCAVLYSNRAL